MTTSPHLGSSVCAGKCLHSSDFLAMSSVLQEQYQYLYKAMLSLISTKENGSSLMSLDRNGSMAMSEESDPAESMESLV